MAHVMIPAREDVDAGAIHHSGTQMQPISLKGEGCEVEQVNGSSFVIKVTQPSFDAFGAITDLSPVYDTLHDMELLLAQESEQSKELQASLSQLRLALKSTEANVDNLAHSIGRLLIDIDGLTANQFEARQKQKYVFVAASLAFVLAFIAAGLSLWTLKV